MVKNGIINDTTISRPLAHASLINPEGNKRKKHLVATVILTSLIDAFSILVIYLLVNFSNSGEILYMSKDMQLPAAAQSEQLHRSTLVKIEKGQLYIEEKPITSGQLVNQLVAIKKKLVDENSEDKNSLTVQADKRVKYKMLNEIVLAGSHAGFSEIRFAVLAK